MSQISGSPCCANASALRLAQRPNSVINSLQEEDSMTRDGRKVENTNFTRVLKIKTVLHRAAFVIIFPYNSLLHCLAVMQ